MNRRSLVLVMNVAAATTGLRVPLALAWDPRLVPDAVAILVHPRLTGLLPPNRALSRLPLPRLAPSLLLLTSARTHPFGRIERCQL